MSQELLSESALKERQAKLLAVVEQLDKILLGQHELHKLVIIGILSRGHILLEGLPGVGKTALVKALGNILSLQFSRVQFTPDYGAQRKDKKVRSHLPGERHNSSRLGSFAVDAEQKEEKSTLKGGQLQTRSSHAGFQQSTLHPAHRKAVKRYFEKERKNP